MSIYNMIASIVGGGGGEVETGTCTRVSAYKETATFQNTHTREPDIALCYPSDGVGTSDRLAWVIYITSVGAFSDEVDALYGQNYFFVNVKNDSSPTSKFFRFSDSSLNQYVTNEGISFEPYTNTDAWSFQASKTYTWWAIWLDGSSSGGGGGGSSKNVQGYHGMDYVNSTTISATDVTLTVAKTGTYKVSWMGFRSTSSGTNGSELYINGTAYGSATTTFTRTYGQSVILDNVSLNKDDVLTVWAISRGSSYYMYVGNLIIEEQ